MGGALREAGGLAPTRGSQPSSPILARTAVLRMGAVAASGGAAPPSGPKGTGTRKGSGRVGRQCGRWPHLAGLRRFRHAMGRLQVVGAQRERHLRPTARYLRDHEHCGGVSTRRGADLPSSRCSSSDLFLSHHRASPRSSQACAPHARAMLIARPILALRPVAMLLLSSSSSRCPLSFFFLSSRSVSFILRACAFPPRATF